MSVNEIENLGSDAAWFAVRTRSNFEQQAMASIADKGIEAYLPAYQMLRQWKDRRKLISRPLFPGYLFVRLQDTNELRVAVLKSVGVVQILGFGNAIESVPEDQVESIRRMLNAKVPCFAHPFLREGSHVKICRGALKDIEGLLVRFKSSYRLVISVEMLCQSVATEVNINDIEPLGYSTPVRQRIA